jgi:endo-1,4-beta-xylanase
MTTKILSLNARVAVLITIVVAIAGTAVCADPSVTLKDAFKDSFSMGVAVNQRQFGGQDTNGVALIISQFNAIAPENALKWQSVHPRAGTNGYDFAAADA